MTCAYDKRTAGHSDGSLAAVSKHLATILNRTMIGYAYEPVLLFRKMFRKG